MDLSNLQRQVIHTTADIGKAKVQSAKETMNAINPDVTVNTYRTFVTSENVMDLIKDYDFIIDGTDNFPAKFLINDACVMAKKPFSHAGIIRFKGQLMTYVPGEGPCYRCVFKDPPPKDAVPTCKQAGVIGAMGGVIGSLQAMEAVKYILGVGDLLTGYLLTYDALKMEFRKIKLPSDTSGCAVCGEERRDHLPDERTTAAGGVPDSGCARRGWTVGVLRRRTYSLGRKPAGGQPPDPRMCAGCPAGNTGERYPLERLPRPRLAHCRRGRVEPRRGADNRRTADRRAAGDAVCRLGRRRRAQTALHGREIAD